MPCTAEPLDLAIVIDVRDAVTGEAGHKFVDVAGGEEREVPSGHYHDIGGDMFESGRGGDRGASARRVFSCPGHLAGDGAAVADDDHLDSRGDSGQDMIEHRDARDQQAGLVWDVHSS